VLPFSFISSFLLLIFVFTIGYLEIHFWISTFVNFTIFFLLLIYSFIPLWLEKVLDMVSVLLSLFRFILELNIWSVLEIGLCEWIQILLLCLGMFHVDLSVTFGIHCYLNLLFPYWSSVWMISVPMKIRCWSLLLFIVSPAIYCVAVCFLLQFCSYLLCIFRCSNVGAHIFSITMSSHERPLCWLSSSLVTIITYRLSCLM
jgi:hypothetical protein